MNQGILSVTNVLATIGLLLTGIGLIGTWQQLRQTRKIALGTFLLNLDTMFEERHTETYFPLLRGGKWTTPGSGPSSIEEWAKVDSYMGLYEQVYILIQQGVLDAKIVERLYAYQIKNLVNNDVICKAKLIDEAEYWSDFIALCQLLDVEVPCRN